MHLNCSLEKKSNLQIINLHYNLNDSILDYEKINLIKNDLNKFELVIEAVKDNGEILINLNFTYHY